MIALVRIIAWLLLFIGAADARENYLSWAASSSVGSASFTGYKVYRCNPSPCTPTVQIGTSTTNQYFDTGLANGTAYVYKVSAYGPGGEAFAPSTVTITTFGAPTTRNVTCSGDITSALTTAINASAAGDIVNIGSGSCSITSQIVITDQGSIIIQGQGIGVTNITANSTNTFKWHVTGTNTAEMRITGFSLTGTGSPIPIFIENDDEARWKGGFRIDHVDINYPAGGAGIYLFGPIFGLIDHINCVMVTEACILTSLGLSTEDGPGYGNPINLGNVFGGFSSTLKFRPGAADYLYIEDSTFSAAAGATVGMSPIDTDRSGCRVVFRHNTVTSGFLYAHWTGDTNINTCFWDINSNTFNFTIPGVDIYPGRMQGGGTGLIHDNTITGYTFNFFQMGEARLPDENQSSAYLNLCDGTQTFDNAAGDTNAPGWPCLAQIGRDAGASPTQIQGGMKQASFPLYLWNNGPQAKCSNPGAGGAACNNSTTANWFNGGTNCGSGAINCANYFLNTPHTVSGGGYGQGDVDWCLNASQPSGCGTHTLIYTSYTYPHPMNQ